MEKTEQRMTSADIKRQIDAAKAAQAVKDEIKTSGLPLTGGLASGINASESTTNGSANESQPVPPATKGVETAKASNDAALMDWAKKKGIDWTTEDSVLSALRKSDQAFHAKRATEKQREEAQQRPAYQPPAYQPAYTPQPAYVPPANNPVLVSNIAKQYGMTPEDVERLMAFNRDFFEVATKAEREKTRAELEAIRNENQKNSVFRELSSDPVFRDPRVGEEYTRVIEEMQERDPQAFENPNAYRAAYDRTLANIGRRNLEGRPLSEGVPPSPGVQLPTSPPRSLGNGSGGGASENENGIDPAQFAKLSLDDKRKMLEGMGLRPAY